MLTREFPNIPSYHIRHSVNTYGTLYSAYLHLAVNGSAAGPGRLPDRQPTHVSSHLAVASVNRVDEVQATAKMAQELEAAKKKAIKNARKSYFPLCEVAIC